MRENQLSKAYVFRLLVLVTFLLGFHSHAKTCERYFHIKTDDPYLQYEEVYNADVLAWARTENQKTFDRLKARPEYQETYEKVLSYMNSKDRIVGVSFYAKTDIVRNFWQDAVNPQGVLRQSTQEKYFAKDPQWETILDIDLLGKTEGKRWVYAGTTYPIGNSQIGLIKLSDGGKDAAVYREFDFAKREFVKDGFELPESKNKVDWLDENTLMVSDALTPENQTTSGYPRVIKIWKRGTPYSEAQTIYEGSRDDLTVATWRIKVTDTQKETLLIVTKDFYNSETYVLRNGQRIPLQVPTNSNWVTTFKGRVFLMLKSDWTLDGQTFKQGSIVHFDFNEFLETKSGVQLFLEPIKNGTVESISSSDNFVYVQTLEDVKTRIYQYSFENGKWSKKTLPIPDFGSAYLNSSPDDGGFVLYTYQSFLVPSTLYKMDEKTLQTTVVKSLPPRFDSSQYKVEQHFATSKDGTRVPYFMISGKNIKLDGKNPTLQYGYGGFEISRTPSYMASEEFGWLRHGGVYVLTNIRGGGEYGPAWHQAALKHNRHKAFEDFIAISEDLITKGVTSPEHLAIEGGSNGGLLTGTVVTMRPDLYNGAIIQVPLLDMLRYHKLLAGASWMGEYGNPDIPADRQYLLTYSPYQNLKPDVKYPEVFLMTSTADDRVHPGHARKFAKRLSEYGNPYLYYENIEGGHGGSANNDQSAQSFALKKMYLLEKLTSSQD